MSSIINILLADDDHDDCLFFREALEELPLSANLTVVNDGVQLMQLLTINTTSKYHVLFLDLNMPRKNGLTCLSEIKISENLKSLPVIIFSTSYEESIAKGLYEKGAQYYICKPNDFALLKEVIHTALNLIIKETTTQPPKEKFLLSSIRMSLL